MIPIQRTSLSSFHLVDGSSVTLLWLSAMRSVILCFATCVSAALAAPGNIVKRSSDGRPRAIYTLSNEPSGSNILALSLDSGNGQVSSPTLTSTGGKGLLGLDIGPPFGTPGSTAGPDGLFGQGAVKVSQDYLFTVNPGSHTLSMFVIYPWDPLHPHLVGQPVDTQGEFPTSVDYSPKLQVACVLNGGAIAGVACFDVSFFGGLKPRGSLRPLSELKQKTPPTGPPGTGSQISFNPDSTTILVTIKGSPGPPAAPGYIYAFPVTSKGDVGPTPVVSQISDLILDFSINFLGSNNLAMITDPAFGASFVSIGTDLKVTETKHTVIPNQGAACWGVYSPRYDAAYVIDAGRPNITLLDPASGAIKGAINYDAAAKGGFDTAINRQWLYALTGDSSLLVVHLEGSGGQQVQKYPLADYGPAGHWQGMAAWPHEQGES